VRPSSDEVVVSMACWSFAEHASGSRPIIMIMIATIRFFIEER